MSALVSATSTMGVESPSEFVRPTIDWLAVAPELILLGWGALVTLIDVVFLERSRRYIPILTSFGFLIATVPLFVMGSNQDELPRVMFSGGYVVDGYSLVIKAMFLLVAYVIVLMGTDYLADGDYYDSEFYQLIGASVAGMVVMASARDLITMFIAIELISIPAYLMAAWRKRDLKSNEAGLKYMLMGVFASSLLLYGMSIVYGLSSNTQLDRINRVLFEVGDQPILIAGIILTLIGLAFKVSAVPFHTWAPDTYEGAPTPLTAFLSVASKAAGFVGIIAIVMSAFASNYEIIQPFMWIISAFTMTVGNLIALRQTNVVRMLAYSGIAQAGYILAPLAVYSTNPDLARSAMVNYLLVYSAMNLGAFAVVIALARKTRSGEIGSFGGSAWYAPGLTAAMTLFLFSLAGIPPAGGWLAKWKLFESLIYTPTDALPKRGVALAIILAVNSVIAAFYYLNVAKQMWFMPVANNDKSAVVAPAGVKVAIALCALVTLVAGVTNLMPELASYEFGPFS